MLSPTLETTLNRAFKLAVEKKHEFVTLEHLLLALSDDEGTRGARGLRGRCCQSKRDPGGLYR